MAKRIFITATNTDIGKTYTTTLLVEAYSKMGYHVGVYKPIETGVNGLPQDGMKLLKEAQRWNPKFSSYRVQDVVTFSYPLPAAPYVASKGKKMDWKPFEEAVDKLEKACDILLIEGAGGLYVPIDESKMMIDVPLHFNAVTLLVSHCVLGCINDTLMSQKALIDANLPFVWGLNCKKGDESFSQVSYPYFKQRFEEILFIEKDIDIIAQRLLDTISLD